jgi:fimbrial chaperone protein
MLLAAGLVVCQTRTARAASFTVNPTQLFLSAASQSGLVTLKNESEKPIRFQLTVKSWGQAPDGQMQLAATEDIIFFPTLLTLAQGEERKVRVGAATPFGVKEKTYRLFVEELPPLDQDGTPGAVTMLTRMGIPIFLQPAKPSARATLRDLGVRGGIATFSLFNEGTVHFLPQTIRLRGFGESGVVALDQEEAGWYVLAGGSRKYEVPIPVSDCARIRSIAIEISVSGTTITDRLQTPAGACGR